MTSTDEKRTVEVDTDKFYFSCRPSRRMRLSLPSLPKASAADNSTSGEFNVIVWCLGLNIACCRCRLKFFKQLTRRECRWGRRLHPIKRQKVSVHRNVLTDLDGKRKYLRKWHHDLDTKVTASNALIKTNAWKAVRRSWKRLAKC